MKVIQITATGGPEVMHVMDLPDRRPGRGELLVDVAAAGVNFLDVYHRTGLYDLALPATLGVEGAGTVMEVGDDVTDIAPGDRVAWADVLGSYTDRAALPQERVTPIPPDLDLTVAAAAMVQGMTAHYLCHDTFRLREGHRCLIHAGAGGVGHLLIQMAKRLGAEVFTTVGSAAKAAAARAAGADHVIEYQGQDFGDAIEEIAGPRPLDVVYDGVGRATFGRGLELLRVRGMMVTFGNASGPVDPVAPLRLSQLGSLFLTRPMLSHHIATTGELRQRAATVLGWAGAGDLDVTIGTSLPLVEAAAAHELLTARRTTGKVLLIP